MRACLLSLLLLVGCRHDNKVAPTAMAPDLRFCDTLKGTPQELPCVLNEMALAGQKAR